MKPEREAPERELLAGQVERVTFHSEESGFAVLRVRVRGRRDAVTVVGHAAAISPGEELRASGTWTNDPKHGPQFKAETVTTVTPTSAEGIERFLASGLVKGVGPHFARRLVDAFGTAVFEVIEAEPGRLREVPGVGPLRAERIVASWAEQKGVREIMVFLHSHGVGTSRAVRIYRTYGADAISVVSKDPYRLARDVRGIGFVTADALARRLGIPEDAMIRVRAGVSHVLAEALDEGHCGLPRQTLVTRAADLLNRPEEQVTEALELELADRHLVAEEEGGRACVFLPALHAAERVIAERIAALAAGAPPWRRSDPATAIPWVEARTGITLSPSQRSAVGAFLRSKVLVLTGGPGVGKTTLVDALLRIVFAESLRIALAAPTGRAARRLSESTRMEAKTIHRLLEVDPSTGRFRRGRDNPLEADLVVVDEVSMIDVLLARSLLEAMPPGAALFLVGDADQLPSVGPGAGPARPPRVGGRPVGAADGDLPAGGREPDRRRGAPDPRRAPPRPDEPSRHRPLLLRREGAGGRRAPRGRGRLREDPAALRPRPDARRAGPRPGPPRPARRARAERGAREGAEPGRDAPRVALRPGAGPGGPRDAGRERLRQGGLPTATSAS